MKHIFIVGCKGLPAKYGGFETFCDCLVSKKQSKDIQYHVACLASNEQEFEYHGARCYNVNVPKILGPAKVIYYDMKAMKMALDYIEEKEIKAAIIYMLGCTAGPFLNSIYQRMKKLGVQFYINPDGHEFQRAKWIKPIQIYLKYSEKVIIKHSDLVISDSIGIENYVLKEYKKYHPKSKFIAYGADLHDEHYGLDHLDTLYKWYKEKGIVNHDYYLIVGRFVPENNYETMIREFMKSKTHRKLVIITNVEKNKFYNKLKEKTHFDKDPRICFVGTVYDSKLLYLIRKNAFAYLHGHEVGGTNPSLLESLASTSLNILLNVDFNNTVGLDGAKYFTKEQGNLADLIDSIEKSMSEEEIEELGKKAKQRIKDAYNWPFIIQSYEDLFLEKNI